MSLRKGKYESILGMDVAVVSRSVVRRYVDKWVLNGGGRYVCVSNVHMCMQAFDSADFRSIVNESDLTIPDGLPLVWAQKLLGHRDAKQVRGTDLTLDICELAETEALPIGLFGGRSKVLEQLTRMLHSKFPRLNIVYAVSPPFRNVSEEEDRQYVADIDKLGVRILFVGLGCPKQEKWMAEHKNSVGAVMLGVGAAFDFIAGNITSAPKWVQVMGLEWLFRLVSEPRRLWKRYLKNNPRFIWHFSKQLFQKKFVQTQ